jgi:copper chaperone
MEIELKVEGMHCDACVRRLKKALEQVPGLRVIDVGVGHAKLDPGTASADDVNRAVTKAGYTVVK